MQSLKGADELVGCVFCYERRRQRHECWCFCDFSSETSIVTAAMEGGVEDVGASAGRKLAATCGGEVRWLLGAAVVGLRSTTGMDKVKLLSAGPRCCQSWNKLRLTDHGVAQERI
ncbi:hypothetical protein NC653_035327 [Populus alba x Populus x berolinensis]|uniref:Uncharacterized protein n=1 Tax=Populus alba x Populus x berolinensis TaxID=444605 RepID=A0AAD6LQ86_9ROSI|nr:hypothetical protein NC653_035327 [Populus alba x Populus x berolinensis]